MNTCGRIKTVASLSVMIVVTAMISVFAVQCNAQKQEKKSPALTTEEQTTEQKPAQKSTDTSTTHVDNKKNTKNAIKVTFIELGSVNCIPCKMMQPVMEAIEKEYGDQVKVVFHDVWTPQGKPYAQKYKILAIPTQIFLDDKGEEYYRHQGFFPKEDLVQILFQKGVQEKP